MFAQAQHLARNAVADVPLEPFSLPIFVPFRTVCWRNEELHFHLFEFTRAEDEVAWGDFVAERLTHLGDTEWWLLATRCEHVGEVHKHALGRLGAQVHLGTRTLDGASSSLEHQVECPSFSKSAALHFFRAITRVELILAKASFTDRAIHQWITEIGKMPAGFERLRRVQDCGVNEHHIVASLHHGANPGVFDIAQHEGAERAVVVGRAKPAVNFGTLKRKPAALGQIDDLFQIFRWHRIQTTRQPSCGASNNEEERMRRSKWCSIA